MALHFTFLHFGPLSPWMVSPEKRVQSFERAPIPWYTTPYPQPESLGAAGFYYYRLPDLVKCFYCSLVLGCWEKHEDPWLEHRRWSPRCTFLELNAPVAQTTLENVQNDEGDKRTCAVCLVNKATILFLPCKHLSCCTLCAVSMSDCPICRKKVIILQKMETTLVKCVVCKKESATILHSPCRHISSCTTCGLKLDKCPLCMNNVTTNTIVY